MYRNRHTVRARVRLLPTSDGGRSTGIVSGYRSLIRFINSEEDFGFELTLDSRLLLPGAEGMADLSFWAAEALPSLFADLQFEIREGAKIVGYGELVDVGSIK